MPDQFKLTTKRLALRLLKISDAEAIQSIASLREISDTMISVPHPYPDNEAERYISERLKRLKKGDCITLAIEKLTGHNFYGLIEIRDIEQEHSQAELSFWLAPAVWGHGYMSEALDAVVCFAFKSLGLNRLYAYHMLRNPASGKVLKKNGFIQEGILRQRVRKWGLFEDVALWSILYDEWCKKHKAI
jgi:RimJ/RimL family protein N-acetyltransferase